MMMRSQTSSSIYSQRRSNCTVLVSSHATTNVLQYYIHIVSTLFVFVIVTTNTIATFTNIRTTSAFLSGRTSVPAWIIRSIATSSNTGSGIIARCRDYCTKSSHISSSSSLQFRRGGVPFVATIPFQPAARKSYDYKHISSTTSTGTRLFHSTSSSSSSSILSNPEGIMEVAPIAYRDEENGFVYAGVAPEGWDVEIPRQDEKSNEAMMDPPIKISDPYHWMRDDTRTDPKVLDLLKLENEYTNAITKHLTQPTSSTSSSSSSSPGADDVDGAATGSSIVTTLYNEMLSVLQESDYTTPRPNQNFLYYKRTIEGKAYTIYCRSEITSEQQMLWTTTTDTTTAMTNEQRQTTPIYNNEQILLDVNVLGIDQSYCAIGTTQISPSQKYYAYTIDYTGDEICTLMIIDITDPKQQHVTVHENTVDTFPISGSIEWGNDDTTMYYLKLDAAQRPYQVYQRTFQWDEDSKQPIFSKFTDTLIYEDLNDAHWVGIYKSQDDQYLFIESSSKETTEIHYIRLQQQQQQQNPIQLQCIAQRRSKVLYEVDHRNGLWWITSNVQYSMDQPNMALYTSPAIPNCESSWTLVTTTATNENSNNQQVLFDGNIQCSIDGVSCFQNHVVVYGREDGLSQIWILGQINDPKDDRDISNFTSTMVQQFERLTFEEEAFDVGLGTHYEYNTDKILVMYESMITPTQSIEIDMTNTQLRTIVKEKNVPKYDKTLYNCERRMVPSRDGTTQIPISMVYRKDVMEEHQLTKQPVPVHLYGYGSYGACMECDFVATRLPLLQRNMIYVVAHVRGGGEMGRHWYEEPNGGKYLCKKNTFNDFCDVAQWLISTEQLTTNQLLSCEGRSAGGLLIGASINLSPELFKVAILGVPFVDVVPTMIDASIPLTAGEWEEWGNPNEVKFHQYMMEYSPTFNVKMGATYPACLLTGGLHDPRVQYWEPMKFVAALRYGSANYKQSEGPNGSSSSSAPICLKIDMSAGHFSASDRYKYYKEKAFDYAFLLDQLGLV